MTWIKLPIRYKALAFALVLVIVGFTSSLVQVSAQPAKPANNSGTSGRQIIFKRPKAPDRGVPGRTDQAASRGSTCPQIDTALTALVPISETTSGEQVIWGLTSAEYPTFWFYVPYPLTRERPGEFNLMEQDKPDYLKASIRVTGTTPGVVSIRLPSTEAPLEIGKLYTYEFVVFCDPEVTEDKKFVRASVERKAPSDSLASQLSTATPRERVVLYAQEGFWDDALTALGELRQANPSDAALAADWDALLEAGGLDEIRQKPIVHIYQ